MGSPVNEGKREKYFHAAEVAFLFCCELANLNMLKQCFVRFLKC